MEQKYDLAVEEIKEAKNPVEKEMLLQKYGMIDPKLTADDEFLIEIETTIDNAVDNVARRLAEFLSCGDVL
jgi:hypothetical protein